MQILRASWNPSIVYQMTQLNQELKKMNRHTPSGWCTYSKFSYGDVSDPLKVYRGKDCAEKFIDHIVAETERLYATFPEKAMTH